MASDRIQRQIDRLLDEAEDAFDQGEWSRLNERAKRVLLLDAENSDALSFLTAAERALGGAAPPASDQPAASTPGTSAQTTDQPTSFANGRYQVRRFLGEGGKKKVYLAQDTTLDREVAFALIKTEGLDDISRTRIQREAQAMGRLGSHPHIVTVFDLGEEGDQPYMVTE
ncbi:MAG: hypothetical protein J4N69_06220, partial [Chloroflexi bacterium]|nr:hypothetical protein [Chloroflexota bacterium]